MRFLILAVSYKHGGLCVAGLDYDSLEYVRIGYDNNGECEAIPTNDFCCLLNGLRYQLNILDLIDIDVCKMQSSGCQTENYNLLKINRLISRVSINDIENIYKKINLKEYVFLDTSAYVQKNNIINICESLQFVKVDNLSITTFQNMNGNTRLKATFVYKGKRYIDISVTDSVFCAYPNVYGTSIKICSKKSAYIMVSLPYDSWAIDKERFYKYIAGIILI